MGNFNLENNEEIFLEGAGVYLKSTINVTQGTFYLTSKRFLFCKRSGLFNALAGPLLMHLKKGKHLVFDVTFSEIKRINSEKHGFGSKYILTTSKGDVFSFHFNSSKEKWIKSIQEAITNHNSDVEIKQIGDSITFSIK